MILICLAVIGFVVYQTWVSSHLGDELLGEKGRDIDVQDFPYLGEKDAPITIVEYGDYRCSYCRLFYVNVLTNTRFQSLIKSGKIKFVYKDYPFLSEDSERSAIYLRGIYERFGTEAYWKMHDTLYRNQTKDKNNKNYFTEKRLAQYAEEVLGTKDTEQANGALKNKQYISFVENSLMDGKDHGVDGTPTVFINNHPILQEPWNLENMLKAIEVIAER